MKTTILFTALALMLNIGMFASNEKENKNHKEKNTAASELTTTILNGQILDKGTGEALAGVKVVLEGTNQTVYSDLDGDFSFETVKPGKYKIKMDYISYKTTVIESISVAKGANSLKIELNPVNK